MHKIISCIAVIVFMALIFKFSSQMTENTSKLSLGITGINEEFRLGIASLIVLGLVWI